MKKKLTTLLLFIVSSLTFGQGTPIYFTDNEREEGNILSGCKFNDKIIIVGTSFEERKIPTVICLDTSGNVLWNTALYDNTNYTNNTSNFQRQIFVGVDNFLYTSGMHANNIENWKLDPNTGEILWKKSTPNAYSSSDIKDYNSSSYLMLYDSAYNGFNFTKKLDLISKVDGNVIQSKTFYNTPFTRTWNVAIDDEYNIIFFLGNSLYKMDGNDWNNIIWQENYSDIEEFESIFINPLDQNIVAFTINHEGFSNYGNMSVFDNSTGAYVTDTALYIDEYYNVSDYKISDNNIYLSLKLSTTGNSFLSILKFNLENYNLEWLKIEPLPTTEVNINTIDLDDDGFLYCSGGIGDGMLIAKLNTQNGDTLYTRIIKPLTMDSEINGTSTKFISVIGQKVCAVGNFTSTYHNENMNFIRADKTTGIFDKNITFGGDVVKHDSKVIDIAEFTNNTKLVLVKEGNVGFLIRYDSLFNVIWKKNIDINSYNRNVPHRIYIENPEKISVSYKKNPVTAYPPYFATYSNEMKIANFYSNGEPYINYVTFNQTSNNVEPLEFHRQGSNSVLLYFDYLSTKIHSFDPYNYTTLNFQKPNFSKNNLSSNLTSTKSIISGNQPPFLKIHTYSFPTTILATKQYNMVNATLYCSTTLDSNHVLLGAINAGKIMIMNFDVNLNDTLWSYSDNINTNMSFINMILTKDKNSLYTLSNTNSDIVVKKINLIDHSTTWSKTYNGISNNVDFAHDFIYDTIRNQLVIVGYETTTPNVNTNPLILKLDTLGNIIDTTILLNDQPYLGEFSKVTIDANGIVMVGGNHFNDQFGKSGILFTSNNALTHHTENIEICPEFNWSVNNITYSENGSYTYYSLSNPDTVFHLNLTISNPTETEITNSYFIPSDVNDCNGKISLFAEGDFPAELMIDEILISSSFDGHEIVQNLCSGLHDVQIIGNCGDTLFSQIVIPSDSNFIFNNPFVDSIAQDSLGNTITDCDIYYNSIDTAYIDSIWNNGNTIYVIWNIIDANGSNYDTTTYVLMNGNGVYYLQFTLFCPFKSLGQQFTVTQAVYFENGIPYLSPSTNGLNKIKAPFDITLFPNPTNDIVKIVCSTSSLNLIIKDSHGKIIKTNRVQNNDQISMKEFENGVYFFEFISEKGSLTKKIIKLH